MTDIVEKMQKAQGGLLPSFPQRRDVQGKAYAVPQVVSPWPLITRMDILEAAKVDPPKTWDEFVEVCKKLQNRHGSPALVCVWDCRMILTPMR